MDMEGYVDGFVFAVQKKKLKAYTAMATLGGKIWMKHGALEYMECVGDDLKSYPGMLPFKNLLKLKANEVACFSFIVYKNKKHRDSVNKKVMADPGMHPDQWKDKPMPVAMNRMASAGFKPIVNKKR
jgi:uncharacterized protein YbaA (DUF1428 family)